MRPLWRINFHEFQLACFVFTVLCGYPASGENEKTFTCISGEKINKLLTCDGISHCADGSDETANVCLKQSCPGYMYRCKYGACVKISSPCNGIADCVDGSDEPPTYNCKNLASSTTQSQTVPTIITTVSSSSSKVYTPFSPIKTTKSTTVKSSTKTSTTSKTTTPSSKSGSKSCKLPLVKPDKKYTINNCTVDMVADVCYSKPGSSVPHLTYLNYQCNPGYFHPRNDEYTVTCVNGEWTPDITQCEECGLFDGSSNSSPWNVGIYDKYTNELQCTGTIVSTFVVLTAAHCFYDDNTKTKKSPNDFYIMVSKISAAHNISDTNYTKQYEVRGIRFSEGGFYGLDSNYASDVAVLEINPRIEFNPEVTAACVEWNRERKFSVPEKTQGQVAGWGSGEIVQTVKLQYMSYGNCLKNASSLFRNMVTMDKICAGYSIDPNNADIGNAGSGYLFPKSGSKSLFLYGVENIQVNDEAFNPIIVFTDVTYHIQWINLVKNEINERRYSENFINLRITG